MRHFATTSVNNQNLFHKWYQYIRNLDLELQSIYDFIYWQNPNYQILNYTPGVQQTYYSYQELLDKGYLHEVCFYDSSQEAPKGERTANALLVFPSKLTLHQGLMNNFKPYEYGVYLCFWDPKIFKDFIVGDIEDKIWVLPDILLSNGFNEEITRWIPVNEDNVSLDTPNPNSLIATSGVDFAYWRMVFNEESDTIPNTQPIENLDEASLIFNNYRIVSYDESKNLVAPSVFIPFKEAFFIISLAQTEDNLDNSLSPVRLDPKNYLYCRMAGGSPYYTLNNFTFSFKERGSATYGNTNLFILTSDPIRVACNINWPTATTSLGLLSYKMSPWKAQLQNMHGVPWTGSKALNHHIHLTNKTDNILWTSEEIFTENSSAIRVANIDKNKIPYYTININEGKDLKEIEAANISLDVTIW